MATTHNPYANLPKVIEVIGIDDAGEYGNAYCPHCGAEGRYTYHFVCDDGSHRGAMKGCFSHFPKHRYADRMAKIVAKQEQLRGTDRSLASWDADVADAIREFASGNITEQECDSILRIADSRKQAWMKKKGYR